MCRLINKLVYGLPVPAISLLHSTMMIEAHREVIQTLDSLRGRSRLPTELIELITFHLLSGQALQSKSEWQNQIITASHSCSQTCHWCYDLRADELLELSTNSNDLRIQVEFFFFLPFFFLISSFIIEFVFHFKVKRTHEGEIEKKRRKKKETEVTFFSNYIYIYIFEMDFSILWSNARWSIIVPQLNSCSSWIQTRISNSNSDSRDDFQSWDTRADHLEWSKISRTYRWTHLSSLSSNRFLNPLESGRWTGSYRIQSDRGYGSWRLFGGWDRRPMDDLRTCFWSSPQRSSTLSSLAHHSIRSILEAMWSCAWIFKFLVCWVS